MTVKRVLPSMRALALLLAVATLAAACAPATGRQSSAPIRAGNTPIVAKGGETIHVRVDYSLEAFGLQESDLTPAIWVPSGYSSEMGDVTAYFGLNNVQGATGWNISLSQVLVERISTRMESFGTSTTRYELWAEIRVGIPEEPIPGVYRVRGTLQARGGATRPLAFSVEVR